MVIIRNTVFLIVSGIFSMTVSFVQAIAEPLVELNADLKSEDWRLINLDIAVDMHDALTEYCNSTSGTVIFDEFRIHPFDAAISSFVYNEWEELSHILGADNFYTEYIYNDISSLDEILMEILDREYEVGTFPEGYEGKVRSTKNIIHYARTAD